MKTWNIERNILQYHLTHKQMETHGHIFSNVFTNMVVLKHRADSIHSAE